MKKLGVSIIIGSLFLGWVIFVPFLHWIYTFLPQGDWNRFLKLIVTIIIGYCGGIALPLAGVIIGAYFIVK